MESEGVAPAGLDRDVAPGPSATPWERDSAAFPADMFRSWMDCMTRPFEFFDAVNPEAPLVRPLVFFLLFGTVGSALGTLSGIASSGLDPEATVLSGGPAGLILMFLSTPFVVLVGLLVYTIAIHLGVRVFVPDARRIGATFRGLCYVAAPQVMSIVPFVGWLVAGLWSLFLAVVAVERLHATSTGRAAAAVLVPFAALMALVLMIAFTLAVLLVAAVGGLT